MVVLPEPISPTRKILVVEFSMPAGSVHARRDFRGKNDSLSHSPAVACSLKLLRSHLLVAAGSLHRRRIRDLTAQEGIVLATGGGAVLTENSRHLLKERGVVVYLRASVSSIVQRTSHDRNRPLLQTADPKARIEELSQQRGPLYQEVAHITVETGRPNVKTVVQNILAQLEKYTAVDDEANAASGDESPADHS